MATVILVEGESDRAALRTLARRRALSLADAEIGAMGGATNIGHCVQRHADARLVGLCDAAEAPYFQRALNGGLFFVCEADLEDELIRALGTATVEDVIADAGELRSYRTFSRMPAQRDRPLDARLHRFLGTTSGRKIRYGTLLTEALNLTRVPPPLDAVLTATGWTRPARSAPATRSG